MRFLFSMSDYDKEFGSTRTVDVSQDGVEYIDDVLELVLTFLRASGYTYVEAVGVDKGSKEQVWTVR